jgi:hypothetical protein
MELPQTPEVSAWLAWVLGLIISGFITVFGLLLFRSVRRVDKDIEANATAVTSLAEIVNKLISTTATRAELEKAYEVMRAAVQEFHTTSKDNALQIGRFVAHLEDEKQYRLDILSLIKATKEDLEVRHRDYELRLQQMERRKISRSRP